MFTARMPASMATVQLTPKRGRVLLVPGGELEQELFRVGFIARECVGAAERGEVLQPVQLPDHAHVRAVASSQRHLGVMKQRPSHPRERVRVPVDSRTQLQLAPEDRDPMREDRVGLAGRLGDGLGKVLADDLGRPVEVAEPRGEAQPWALANAQRDARDRVAFERAPERLARHIARARTVERAAEKARHVAPRAEQRFPGDFFGSKPPHLLTYFR